MQNLLDLVYRCHRYTPCRNEHARGTQKGLWKIAKKSYPFPRTSSCCVRCRYDPLIAGRDGEKESNPLVTRVILWRAHPSQLPSPSVVNSPLRLASYTSRPAFHDTSFEGHSEVQPNLVPFDENFSRLTPGVRHRRTAGGNNPLWGKKSSHHRILRVVRKSGVYRFACCRRDFRCFDVARIRSVPAVLTKTERADSSKNINVYLIHNFTPYICYLFLPATI